VFLYFSVPVRKGSGTIIGVVRKRYSVSTVQNLIFQNRELAGEKSQAILLDEYHLRLADSLSPQLLFKTTLAFTAEQEATLRQRSRLPNLPSDQIRIDLPDFEHSLQNITSGNPFFAAVLHPKFPEASQAAVAKLQRKPWLVVFEQ